MRLRQRRYRQPDLAAGAGAEAPLRRRARVRDLGHGLNPSTPEPEATSMRWVTAMLGAALLLAVPSAASAQDEPYPSRPVRLVAAAGPGGNPDVLARLLAQKLSDALGKPFVVENVPGAGGVVAANQVAKAPPDGHVLMLGDSGALAISPALNPNLSYHPL